MAVSLQSINSQLAAWEKSSAGQAAIKAKVGEYQKKGVKKTQAGSELMTAERARELANELIGILQSKAGSSAGNGGSGSIPPSVLSHFSSLTAGAPKDNGDGSFSVTISFGDDLTRPSMTNPSTGKPFDIGALNIVAMFNNGVGAPGSVFGIWEGHGKEPRWSQRKRPALGFMQAAKQEFESKYGGSIEVQVTLGGDYK